MSEVTDTLPPVPDHTPPTGIGEKPFALAWLRWFLAVRSKVNAINDSLVNLAAIIAAGIPSSDGSGTWVARTITGTTGRISVVNGDGVAGNPTIDLVNVGTAGTYDGITFDASGRATAGNVTYTVAGLPAVGVGKKAFVTDANTTIILGLGLAVVGGGANKVPVYSDGTNWIIG